MIFKKGACSFNNSPLHALPVAPAGRFEWFTPIMRSIYSQLTARCLLHSLETLLINTVMLRFLPSLWLPDCSAHLLLLLTDFAPGVSKRTSFHGARTSLGRRVSRFKELATEVSNDILHCFTCSRVETVEFDKRRILPGPQFDSMTGSTYLSNYWLTNLVQTNLLHDCCTRWLRIPNSLNGGVDF